jgi:hypothetical protein
VHPRHGTEFKIPRSSGVQSIGQPQPQPFKYLALDAMGHLGKLYSFVTPSASDKEDAGESGPGEQIQQLVTLQ